MRERIEHTEHRRTSTLSTSATSPRADSTPDDGPVAEGPDESAGAERRLAGTSRS
jgi:hypothetical protein